ncbi:MAG: nucleotidyl transferase AbiEii/AbiGii toxin family protein [Candidatus Thermoplasmatota archaeon]|nr:nucleotidyl transferase AbiEii/AbiGii toxin family protein [Candidatus Thermoplasmatota archaeon]
MSGTTGFDEKTIEKIYRLCDILQRISLVQYTKERLSLYGGTGLNFLHFKGIPRLSIDIDFNYRDLKTGDWEKERDRIDTILKKILSDLKYSENDIKIQVKYPITRYDIHYTTKNNQKDSIKIEIGYMRRIPVFKNDINLKFDHFETDERIEVKTPISEELFGNKFCTLLYRYENETDISSRDLYDVYTISKNTFDTEIFETAVIIDSLMHPEPRIYKQNPKTIVDNVSIDNQLLNLIRNREIPKDLKTKSQDFIRKYISISKEKYQDVIDTFFNKHEFNPKLLKNYNILNPDINSHPSILWNLKQLNSMKKWKRKTH